MWTQRSIMSVVWVGLLATCRAQRAEQLLAPNPCLSKTTCSECIRTSSCTWCFAPEGPINGPRCFDPAVEGGVIAGCSEEYIFNPDSGQSIDPKFSRELSRGNRCKNNELALDMCSNSNSLICFYFFSREKSTVHVNL